MDNTSDSDILLIKKFFRLGMGIGQSIKDQIEKGALKVPINRELVILVAKDSYQNQTKLGILDIVVSYILQILTIGNAGLVIIRDNTVVQFSRSYIKIHNKAEKICYRLNLVCSGIGAVTSSVAIFYKRCGLSTMGILGDSLRHVLLKVSNKVNKLKVNRKVFLNLETVKLFVADLLTLVLEQLLLFLFQLVALQ